jgi:hypothetical protein
LAATLPKPAISTPEMVADNSVAATAVLVLNALVAVAVEVPPLLAAAVPTPSAAAVPSFCRLSPVLLLLLKSESVSVDVAVSVSSPAALCWLISPAQTGPSKAALTAVATKDLRILPPWNSAEGERLVNRPDSAILARSKNYVRRLVTYFNLLPAHVLAESTNSLAKKLLA